MRTMTIPSAAMRRLKQAAAASRASQAAAPAAAPVLRRPAGDGGGARAPARVVIQRTSPSSGTVRVIRPAPPPLPASSNSSSSSGKRGGAIAPPPASGRAMIRPADPPAPRAKPPPPPARLVVGDRVLVNTPVTNTPAGLRILVTLGAVVVSAEVVDRYGESYLDVVFDGEFPPHDPSSAVRISRDQVVPPVVAKPSVSSRATSTTVPAPPRPVKREVAGSALRAEEQQKSLKNERCNKRSRY